MKHTHITTAAILCVAVLYSCHKKFVPHNANMPVITANKPVNTLPKKAAVHTTATGSKPITGIAPKKIVTAVPKVIWVNDVVAKKNFDGRLYYDLEGRRYWKNYVDGKYYLFNKSMYTNQAFKPR